MTDTIDQRTDLVEAITREVLAALGVGPSPGAARRDRRPLCLLPARLCRPVRGQGPRHRRRRRLARRVPRPGGRGAARPRPLHRPHAPAPDATAADIDRLCDEAAEHGFAAVCVNPAWVRRAAERLRGSSVAVASVIGFPFGATPSDVKAFEARRAIRDGAREIDMVINIGALKSGMHDLVREDIARVSDACHEGGAANKVIIEAALLTDEEKVVACRLAQQAKADMVKTSTGYAKGGATVFDVALMRETVGPKMGVKAAGGIRTADDVQDMIAAGATRIGASAGVKIVTGKKGADGQY